MLKPREVQGTSIPILSSDSNHFVLVPIAITVYGLLASGVDFIHLDILWDKDYFIFIPLVTCPVKAQGKSQHIVVNQIALCPQVV